MLRSLIGAAQDAARAWLIVPPRHSRRSYDLEAPGGWKLRTRRRFSLLERIQLKRSHAFQVFADSVHVRRSTDLVVPCLPSEGLLANLLHVLEVVHRVREDASVRVDWVLTGTEPGFRYGHAGDDVWTALFGKPGANRTASPLRADQPLDFALWGTGKDYLQGRDLQAHRDAYAATLLRWLPPIDRSVQKTADEIARGFEGRFTIGVHRRVGNARVANLQVDGEVPTAQQFIQSVQAVARQARTTEWAVFLATDDADAVDAFRDAFGDRLLLQGGVQRTTADAVEVHCGSPSFANAVSVMVDVIVLSRCTVLVHASSSISTIVAFMNPRMSLVRVRSKLLPLVTERLDT